MVEPSWSVFLLGTSSILLGGGRTVVANDPPYAYRVGWYSGCDDHAPLWSSPGPVLVTDPRDGLARGLHFRAKPEDFRRYVTISAGLGKSLTVWLLLQRCGV